MLEEAVFTKGFTKITTTLLLKLLLQMSQIQSCFGRAGALPNKPEETVVGCVP